LEILGKGTYEFGCTKPIDLELNDNNGNCI